MHISIAERLRPFSHIPGTSTLLPGTCYEIEIFPCLFRIYDLKNNIRKFLFEGHLTFQGPVTQFTVCQDLEKGRITISGFSLEGWFRYHFLGSTQEEGIRLLVDRAPHKKLHLHLFQESRIVEEKKAYDLIPFSSSHASFNLEKRPRLSFGEHKSQDWENMWRRKQLRELLPFIYRLGCLTPPFSPSSSAVGTGYLLEICQQSLHEGHPEKTEKHWENFIRTAFRHLLVPQLEDTYYQGIIPLAFELPEISPLMLLPAAAQALQKLLIQQHAHSLLILPHLLPSLWCGRFTEVPLIGGGWISMEWTKKCIRRMELHVEHDQDLALHFRSSIRQYRVRGQEEKSVKKISNHASLQLKKNVHYFFDQFE